jgi:hypothetical protein
MTASRSPRQGLALVALLAAGWLLAPAHVWARYRRPDLENVPVARVIGNLEAQAKKKPKDATLRLNLARAHAMAYALKTDTAQVQKGKADKGVWLGYEPRHVPFTVKPTKDPDQVKEARAHLDKAIDWYAKAVKLDPKNLTARLGHAWALEQAGKKEQAIAGYRKVIKDAWVKEKEMRVAPLGWHSVTAEAARYLIPLLDPEKNRVEIATLKDRAAKASRIPRPVTPLVVPLRPGLPARDLIDEKARVRFDADGSGLAREWTWVTPEAGWLVYDRQRTGKITSALQLFGSVTFWMFWENGYRALGALDDNGDGLLTGAELTGLAIWRDANGNGVSEPGEVRPLKAWGITALSCRSESGGAPSGCAAWASKGVRFRKGGWRATYDVVLKPR